MKKFLRERFNLRSHTEEELKEAIRKGFKVFELDTGNFGEDDVLFGYDYNDVLIDILSHHEIDELPEDWELREFRKDELEELGL